MLRFLNLFTTQPTKKYTSNDRFRILMKSSSVCHRFNAFVNVGTLSMAVMHAASYVPTHMSIESVVITRVFLASGILAHSILS